MARTLYVFGPGSLEVGPHGLAPDAAAVLATDRPVTLHAPIDGAPAEALVLQGRPIAEPVAQAGPFVMNDEAEVRQAFADYRAGRFGDWPWASDDPVHDRQQARFARRADGSVEQAEPAPVG